MLKFSYQDGTPIVISTPSQIIFAHGCVSVIPLSMKGEEVIAALPIQPVKRVIAEEDLENGAEAFRLEFEKHLPPRKKGRQINPSSNRQRIFGEISKLLAEGPVRKWKLLLDLKRNLPDLTACQIEGNANNATGIKRDNGLWSLKSA